MAYSKKSAGKSKAVHTAELTTGQLVLAVCTFLIVLLGVFLLGIIVGEYQYKMRETRQTAVASATSDDARGEGTQPGSYDEIKRDSGTKPAEPPPEPEPYRSRTDAASRSVVIPAPSPETVSPPEPASVAKTPLPPPTAPAETAEPEPEVVESAAPAPVVLEPIEASDDASPTESGDADEAAGPIELMEDEPEPATDSSGPKPGEKVYSVQVAALSEPKNADSMKRRLEATTAWPIDIVLSPTKKLHIVFVGRFATEAEAEKARTELRKKAEFSEAFTSSRVLK